jgi:hypothetical protein
VLAAGVDADVAGAAEGDTAGVVLTVRVDTTAGTVAAGVAVEGPEAAEEFLVDAAPDEPDDEPAPPRAECEPRSDDVCVPPSACA